MDERASRFVAPFYLRVLHRNLLGDKAARRIQLLTEMRGVARVRHHPGGSRALAPPGGWAEKSSPSGENPPSLRWPSFNRLLPAAPQLVPNPSRDRPLSVASRYLSSRT